MAPIQRDLNIAQSLSPGIVAAISVTATIILAIFCVLIVLLFRAITNHRRLLADLEQRGTKLSRPMIREINRPGYPKHVSVLRRPFLVPFQKPKWSILDSNEHIGIPVVEQVRLGPIHNFNPQASGLMSIRSLGKPSAKRIPSLCDIQTDPSSAIMEISRNFGFLSSSPPPPSVDGMTSTSDVYDIEQYGPGTSKHSKLQSFPSSFTIQTSTGSPDNLRPKPLFSSKDLKTSLTVGQVNRNRSKTLGATIRPVKSENGGLESPLCRPPIHTRSFSLGSRSPGCAPEGPVPPLPLKVRSFLEKGRPKSWVIERNFSRHSVSSLESVGSSLLVMSPRLNRYGSGRQKICINQGLSNPLIMGPRPLRKAHSLCQKRNPSLEEKTEMASIASNTVAKVQKRNSARETMGSGYEQLETAISGCGNAESPSTKGDVKYEIKSERMEQRVRKTVSSSGAITTPRRYRRPLTTPDGSPTQRKQDSTFKGFSGNGGIKGGQMSCSPIRASSTTSSNGNPFQWDPSPMQSNKPSALKGSPTSRKGHRRQNCVRISLSPTIIEPKTRSSNSTMGDIQEESVNPVSLRAGSKRTSQGTNPSVSPTHPPSASIFAPDIKFSPTCIRASLTSNSPSSSSTNYSDSSSLQEFSTNATELAPAKATSHRTSISSILEIPKFPIPSQMELVHGFSAPTFSFHQNSDTSQDGGPRKVPVEFEISGQGRPETSNEKVVREDINRGQDSKENLNTTTTSFSVFSDTSWRTSKSPLRNEFGSISPPCSPKSKPATSLDTSPILKAVRSTSNSLQGLGVSRVTERSMSQGLKHETKLSEPRANETPSPLRRSIAALRRMNSDAKHDSLTPGTKAAQRYLRFGDREGSPLPGLRCTSWMSLSDENLLANGSTTELREIDRMLSDELVTDECEARWNGGIEAYIAETLELEDTNDQFKNYGTKRAESQIPRKNNDTVETKKENREEVSIWEDCEKYSTKEGLKKTNPERLVLMRKTVLTDLDNRQISEEIPDIKVILATELGTPASLYDENGFLKA